MKLLGIFSKCLNLNHARTILKQKIEHDFPRLKRKKSRNTRSPAFNLPPTKKKNTGIQLNDKVTIKIEKEKKMSFPRKLGSKIYNFLILAQFRITFHEYFLITEIIRRPSTIGRTRIRITITILKHFSQKINYNLHQSTSTAN